MKRNQVLMQLPVKLLAWLALTHKSEVHSEFIYIGLLLQRHTARICFYVKSRRVQEEKGETCCKATGCKHTELKHLGRKWIEHDRGNTCGVIQRALSPIGRRDHWGPVLSFCLGLADC